ncbi:Uncharacterised protein (plasmid) [Tsukamurella tyrosinosolvens]|uniref:DRBM domain-containing protein n=1 Tax=Tsukamurella tyrosinosolvens TaxID=57704 RepID=A0A1H4UZN9_TSUTY|nr:hypothetical protein [Tsukamurella tyrosinosolvens]KXO91093.1 hypothetical protein AXK58_21935 [Tsukamurella tyrosinosolvens]SEC74143.1 hypothetical protein SAMN04489793_3091 [Tsukamurella tyrosinosolvens]VEH90779.1 Uncharacterised protein [Tsukamurella tyrosinosolvens]
MTPTEKYSAAILPSFEQPGQWFWQVLENGPAGSLGENTGTVVESGYRSSEKGAETAALAALIRWRSTE